VIARGVRAQKEFDGIALLDQRPAPWAGERASIKARPTPPPQNQKITPPLKQKKPRKEQICGGMACHVDEIIEMKTGRRGPFC